MQEKNSSASVTDHGSTTCRAIIDVIASVYPNISVNFTGPFLVKQGRGKVKLKLYLCLFAGMNTRAVHLGMAYGLDTDSFMNAFYKMTSRRGFPAQVTSDNGTNFIGAERELRDLVKALGKKKIQDMTLNRGVTWKFNPPSAPHFNGLHEILVKAAKRVMFCVLSKTDLTDEELMTAIAGAERLLNSRPITYETSNADAKKEVGEREARPGSRRSCLAVM